MRKWRIGRASCSHFLASLRVHVNGSAFQAFRSELAPKCSPTSGITFDTRRVSITTRPLMQTTGVKGSRATSRADREHAVPVCSRKGYARFMRMADRDQPKAPSVQQLLAELEQLEREQRALDLRDTAAVERFRQKIRALRQRMSLISGDRRDS